MKWVTLPSVCSQISGPVVAVVGLGVGLVVELVGQHRARRFLHDVLGLHHIVIGMVGRHGGRRDHDFGAVGLEQAHLLLRHLVGHGEDAAVALEARGDRQADAGVAAGPLDDGPAGLQVSPLLRTLDDREGDPVLHRPAGVGVLRLAVDRRPEPRADAGQPDQRRPPDRAQHRVVRRAMGRGGGHGLPWELGWRKCTGWRKGAATGRPLRNAGENRSSRAPESAAESSAG